MTPEEIKYYNELSKKEFENFSLFGTNENKWGFFFPMLLFIAGMSVPFFTNELYAMWFALVPFYGFVYTVVCGSKNEKMREKAVETVAFVWVLSWILALIRWFGLSDLETSFATVTLMGVFNVPASFSSMIVLYLARYINF